jgi:hypothetical protein
VQTVGWLRAHLAPNRQGYGRMTHMTARKCKHRPRFQKPMVNVQVAGRLYNR